MLKRYVFRLLRKEARLSQDLNVVGSSFQIMSAATEKARLPRFSLVLGIERYTKIGATCHPKSTTKLYTKHRSWTANLGKSTKGYDSSRQPEA